MSIYSKKGRKIFTSIIVIIVVVAMIIPMLSYLIR